MPELGSLPQVGPGCPLGHRRKRVRGVAVQPAADLGDREIGVACALRRGLPVLSHGPPPTAIGPVSAAGPIHRQADP